MEWEMFLKRYILCLLLATYIVVCLSILRTNFLQFGTIRGEEGQQKFDYSYPGIANFPG